MLSFADIPERFQQKADTFQVNIGLNVTDVTSVTLFCSYGGVCGFVLLLGRGTRCKRQ